MPAFVKHLDDVLEAVHDGMDRPTVDLVGYSMGGRLALAYALSPGACAMSRKAKVRSLVLISADAGLEPETARAERRDLDDRRAERIREIGTRRFLREWQAQALFKAGRPLDPVLRRSLNRHRVSGAAEGWAAAIAGLSPGRTESLWPLLAQLECPVLALAGALDGRYAGLAAALAQAVQDGQHALINDVGHEAHLEDPRAVARAMSDFYASVAKV